MKKAKIEREPLEEIDLLDVMHSALVDLLIEKDYSGRRIRETHQAKG